MKVKLFDIKVKTDGSEINTWLKANPDVEIISTNTFANEHGWGYIVLYNNGGSQETDDE